MRPRVIGLTLRHVLQLIYDTHTEFYLQAMRRDLELQRQQKNQRRSNTQIVQQAPDDFDMQWTGLEFGPHFRRPMIWSRLFTTTNLLMHLGRHSMNSMQEHYLKSLIIVQKQMCSFPSAHISFNKICQKFMTR